jgi:hypothetical protein
VSWRTDVPSDSTVLFRPQGTTTFTQVSKPGRVTAHQVQVSGLDRNVDYEFAVRSTTCNGNTTTDTNGGAAYDFFRDPPPEPAPLEAPYFFTSDDPAKQDEANKVAFMPTATFETTPPTDLNPAEQRTSALGNESFAENFLLAYWTGEYTGSLHGPIEFDWFWSTAGPPREANVSVTIFADIDRSDGASPVQPDKIVASGALTIDVTNGPVPTRSVGRIDVDGGTAFPTGGTHELVIQVAGDTLTTDNDLIVHYDSTSFPSQFAASTTAPPPPPTGEDGQAVPAVGPAPPPSAGATSFSPPATRHTPTAADLAAGTARCARIVPGR